MNRRGPGIYCSLVLREFGAQQRRDCVENYVEGWVLSLKKGSLKYGRLELVQKLQR